MSCSLVDRYQLLEESFLHPEDTGITFLKKGWHLRAKIRDVTPQETEIFMQSVLIFIPVFLKLVIYIYIYVI
jgi:hypothetical protein